MSKNHFPCNPSFSNQWIERFHLLFCTVCGFLQFLKSIYILICFFENQISFCERWRSKQITIFKKMQCVPKGITFFLSYCLVPVNSPVTIQNAVGSGVECVSEECWSGCLIGSSTASRFNYECRWSHSTSLAPLCVWITHNITKNYSLQRIIFHIAQHLDCRKIFVSKLTKT